MKKVILFTLLITALVILINNVLTGNDANEPKYNMLTSMQDLMGEFQASLLAGEAVDTINMEYSFINEYYGIPEELLVEFEGRISWDNKYCDEYIFMHVAEGKSDQVINFIMTRVEYLKKNKSIYSEDEYLLIDNFKLFSKGDFIVFSIGRSAEKAIDFFTDKIIVE